MNQQDLKTVLSALVMSSPHTDALYRWKDPAWIALRQEAIDILGLLKIQETQEPALSVKEQLA